MTSPDLLFNISAYYLIIMGNLCQSMIYHKKIKYSELSFQEKFSYQRNEILISKGLVEKLKPSTEACYRFEELDTRMYFKYEHLSEKILEEINNDVNFNIEFWNIFKRSKQEYKILDFNKVFYLTDRIRKCKIKVENIWHDLINTFYGFNDIFDLYQNYIEEVNDDDITFRRLETLKNKLLSYYELLGAKNNLQNLLFSKDVGIIILNGGKGKEGMIEKVNENIHKIFNLSNEDLKGCFINILIPKVFERNHRSYIERYITVGEKRIADKRIKTYGKDKSNNIVVISTCVKLFLRYLLFNPSLARLPEIRVFSAPFSAPPLFSRP
jgi:PAS domain-containing protein